MKPSSTLLLVLIACVTLSCDVLEDDALPVNEETQQIQGEVYSTPNNPIIIDLKSRLSFSKEGKVVVSTPPKQGKVNLLESGLVRYTPSASFISGKDLFVMDIVGQTNNLIDSDSVNIVIVSDTTDIPCFNGALSDFVSAPKNKTRLIDILNNDGICYDELENLHIGIVENPDNGIASFNDSSQLVYTPNTDFTGYDSLRYELELTDLNGKKYNSTANVFVHVTFPDTSEPCKTKLASDTFYLNTFQDSQFFLDVLLNDEICDSTDFSIQITKFPERGAATIIEGEYPAFTEIKYTIDSADENYYDHFEYSISEDSSGYVENTIVVVRQERCEFKARDDFHTIDTSYDSTLLDTYVYNVVGNDIFCKDGLTSLELNDPGGYTYSGNVEIKDEQLYYSPASFVPRTDSIGYTVCEGYLCDDALLIIEIK